MSAQHAATPQWDEIVNECAPGIIPFPVSEVMISSVREWASTVALFNIAEDTHGGPVQPPNHGCPGCEPLATVNLQLEAMRASQNLGLPCVNGYSGYFAREWDEFRDYRALLAWLTEKHHVPPEVVAGLVVVGEPVPDPDPRYEAEMRARFPPRAVAVR